MAQVLNDKVAFDAVVDAVEEICGYPREELRSDRMVEQLQIDSLSASEIVQRVELILDTEVDMTQIASSWGTYTLADLAAQFVRQDGNAADGA
jgi:acyl carrier protein